MFTRLAAAGALAAAVLLTAAPVRAGQVRVLDVNVNPGSAITVNAGFGGINANQERAQTFTVGTAGTLLEVDVFIKHFDPAAGSLIFDLRRTLATGYPDTSAPLLTLSIPAASVPTGDGGFVPFDVSSLNLHVTPGTRLAAAVHATPGASTFGWLGWTGNPYTAGSAFERVIGNHGWVDEGAAVNYDLGIRTYVAPVPLPAALPAGLATLTALAAVSRKRRRATP